MTITLDKAPQTLDMIIKEVETITENFIFNFDKTNLENEFSKSEKIIARLNTIYAAVSDIVAYHYRYREYNNHYQTWLNVQETISENATKVRQLVDYHIKLMYQPSKI